MPDHDGGLPDATTRDAISYLAPTLQTEFGVGPDQFAIVFSMGLAGMALGGLGIAPMADRFGRRRMIVAAIGTMAVAMIVSSFARSIAELSVRFVVGTGIGTVLACIAAVAAKVAPLRHRNFAVGILQGGYPIGAMLTGFTFAWALPIYDWNTLLIAAGVISALCIPLIYIILPAGLVSPEDKIKTPIAEVVAGERKGNSILLWTATIAGFMALYFITSWITKLSIEAGLPETDAIIASAIYNLGAFIGTLGMSLIGTKRDIRKIARNLLLGAVVMFLVFGGVSMPLIGVLAAAFLMGITLQGGFNAMYPIAANVYPDRVRATGIGCAFGIGRIGAFSGPANRWLGDGGRSTAGNGVRNFLRPSVHRRDGGERKPVSQPSDSSVLTQMGDQAAIRLHLTAVTAL